MPRKKKGSPYYRVQRKNLPGYGDTGLLSTRTTSLKRAREMEDLLQWLADEEAYDVLDALRPTTAGASGRVTLADVLRAKKEGRFSSWRRTLDDPPLAGALREFAKSVRYNNHKLGLRHVLRVTTEPGGPRLAPKGARLSWLTEARHINAVTSRLLSEGYEPNTVRVSVWYALSKLFRHHYGESRKREIMADAARPHADDARDVWLTARDVHRLVSACEWEVRMALLLMAGLGVDVKPMLALRVRDFDPARWTLYVPDTKTRSRRRTADLPPVLVYALAQLADGRAESDPVLNLSRGQLNHRWRKAREAARLTVETGFSTDLRMKDLRHTFAVHYLKGGGNVAGLAGRMGHTHQAQSLAYAKHEASGTSDVEAAAASLGLALPPRLRAELDELAPRPEERAEAAVEMPAWWFDRSALPRVEAEDGAVATLSVVRGYAERGTAGWTTDAEGRRAYEAGLRERRAAS